MRLRKAGWRDVFMMWRWRNHQTSRKFQRDPKRIGLLEHVRWFWGIRKSNYVKQYIAFDGLTAIGSGRLDLARVGGDANPPLGNLIWIAEIDIVVAPDARGRGYGPKVITALMTNARHLYQAERVYAVISGDNRASLGAFRKAGFVLTQDNKPNDKWLVLEHRA